VPDCLGRQRSLAQVRSGRPIFLGAIQRLACCALGAFAGCAAKKPQVRFLAAGGGLPGAEFGGWQAALRRSVEAGPPRASSADDGGWEGSRERFFRL
jgi:hypothetical protein